MGTQYLPGLGVADFTWMPGVRRIDLLIAAPLILWFIARLAQRSFRNLPPGPKGLPIVGDVFHIANQGWLVSPQRKDEYGDIPHFHCH